MIYKLKFTLFLVLISNSIFAQIEIPKASPPAKIQQTIGLSNISVSYSRPGVKGRTIFGNLVPYNQVWRTGANENTILESEVDIYFADIVIPKGKYAIYTLPNLDKWQLIFYSKSDNWGNPDIWDESKVVARINATPKSTGKNIERFTIEFSNIHDNGATLELSWENTLVEFPFMIQTNKMIEDEIRKTLAGANANDYYTAAVYYKNNNKDLKKAIAWINKAIDMTQDDPKYWFYRQKALIYALSGDKREAVKAAKTSLRLAEQAGATDYVKQNEDSLKEWN